MEPDVASVLALRLYDAAWRIPFVKRDDKAKAPRYKHAYDFDVRDAISVGSGTSKFEILERKYVDKYAPEVTECYELVKDIASFIYNSEVILSPFYRSSINLNMYRNPGDCHAAHADSNPIANLLCLSEGTPLQVLNNNQWVDVPLTPGQLLTFNGRELLHRVPEQKRGDLRIVASMNLYFPDDCSRPDGLDEIAYGES